MRRNGSGIGRRIGTRGLGVGGGGGGPAPAWTPASLTDVRLWLKADRGVTLVGADVNVWADQSGNGNDFSAAAAGNRPLFIASDAGFNSKPAIQFDGVNEWLRNAAFSWGGAITAMHVGLVVRIDVLVNLDRVWSYAAVAPVFLRMGTGPIAVFSGNGVNSSFAWPGVKAWGGAWNGANQWLYDGGTTVDGPDVNAGAMPADGGVFALGSSVTGTVTGAVTIAEAWAQRAIPTAGESASLDAYVASEYGV
jgi:hypothetical protein